MSDLRDVNIEYPFGEMQVVVPVIAEGATTVEVDSTKTLINLGELNAAVTLNLAIGSAVKIGSELIVKAKSDATARAVTLGAGFAGPATIAGTASKTKVQIFVYDGTAFIGVAALVQLD